MYSFSGSLKSSVCNCKGRLHQRHLTSSRD